MSTPHQSDNNNQYTQIHLSSNSLGADIFLDSNDKIRVIKGLILLISFFTLIISSMLLYNAPNYNPDIILTSLYADEDYFQNNNIEQYNNPVYKLMSKSINKKEKTIIMDVALERIGKDNPYIKNSTPINNLKFIIKFARDRCHIKITDNENNNNNYEIPKNLFNFNDIDFSSAQQISSLDNSNIGIKIYNHPFGFTLFRKESEEIIFDTFHFYKNNNFNTYMYISNEIKQISTILPKESFIYHLNYEDNDNKQNLFYYNRKENPHSYPHYIIIDKSSMRAHGIILFNSSPIKVQINQNQDNNFINYKINSGDIDLFVFDGPKVKDITYQIQATFGKPVIHKKFDLEMNEISYYNIINPVNVNSEIYKKYENKSICYKDNYGKTLIGKIKSYSQKFENDDNDYCILDYTNEFSSIFRKEMFNSLYNNQTGIILDLNIPYLDITNNVDNEKQNENILFTDEELNAHTIPYNLNNKNIINTHNLYSIYEVQTYYNLLTDIYERPMIFSSSSFIGIQQYSGQYNSNIDFSWNGLKKMIKKTILFNLFGNPNIINTINIQEEYKELYVRWLQFLTLNIHFKLSNEEYINKILNFNDEYSTSIKNSLKLRNELNLYIYTYHIKNHLEGGGYIMSLSSYFSSNQNILNLFSEQFMLGGNIMVGPIIKSNERVKSTFFPSNEIFYDYYTFSKIENVNNENINIDIDAPLKKIPIFLRGGFITPIQEISNEEYNISDSDLIKKNINLIIALDNDYQSQGKIIFDNFISENYFRIDFVTIFKSDESKLELLMRVTKNSFDLPNDIYPYYEKIFFLGLGKKPSYIKYFRKDIEENEEIKDLNDNCFVYDENKELLVINLKDSFIRVNNKDEKKIVLYDIE